MLQPPGIQSIRQVVAPTCETRTLLQLPQDYFVCHLHPGGIAKRWQQDNWQKLIQELISQFSIPVVITGSGAASELDYINSILANLPDTTPMEALVNFAGKLTLGELGALIDNARCYIGSDTSRTQLAATTDCPIITLFGPTCRTIWTPHRNEESAAPVVLLPQTTPAAGELGIAKPQKLIDTVCRHMRPIRKIRLTPETTSC
jgi:ADP-heptose:LPS heptosyltransferase